MFWGTTSEAQKQAQARYDADNTVRVSLKLNKRTDQDIIMWLNRQDSKQGAVKQLIRQELSTSNK